eukprot:COSAG04_NODE_2180_length_4609_cov_5.154989_2_plen_197_part_00
MENDKTLAYYNVQKEDTLHLMIRAVRKPEEKSDEVQARVDAEVEQIRRDTAYHTAQDPDAVKSFVQQVYGDKAGMDMTGNGDTWQPTGHDGGLFINLARLQTGTAQLVGLCRWLPAVSGTLKSLDLSMQGMLGGSELANPGLPGDPGLSADAGRALAAVLPHLTQLQELNLDYNFGEGCVEVKLAIEAAAPAGCRV